MRRCAPAALLLFLALLTSCPALGQEDMQSFYPKVRGLAESPPDESSLKIVCQKKVGDRYVTFAGVDGKTLLLATVTPFKLRDASKSLWLRQRFVPAGARGRKQTTSDWGYVFDRNGDGRVDYVCFLMGPMPIKPADFPADFPKADAQGHIAMSREQLDYFMKHSAFVFRHYADENFDGELDAVLVEELDPERMWVDRWLVAKSSHFDGVMDTAWCFTDDPSVPQSVPEKADGGYRWHGYGREIMDAAYLEGFSQTVYSPLRAGAEACGLTKDSFWRP
jgi:hypothetical protein